MTSSLPICDICMTDNITKSASVWCPECEEAICNECVRQHGRMGLTKNHKTIPITDYQKLPSSVAAIKQKCIRHSLKFEFYCVFHNEPCCVSCVAEKHGSCPKLKPLSAVVGGVKSSAAFVDLEDRAKDISALIGNLITEKQNNRASFGVQKNKIISEVQDVRAAINNHLVKLEKDLLDKLENMEKKQYGSINNFIEKLSEMRIQVENICSDLEKTKKHASNFQAFFGIHELNKRIEIEERDWMSLQIDQIMDTVDIHIEFSPILMKFDKDVKELGKIKVEYISSKKILLQKEKQGQTLMFVDNTLDNIKLTNICSFPTPEGASKNILITGIDMFDDGRIVLADQSSNKRLVIMNLEGELIKTIQLEDRCSDVAVIGKDIVATTLLYKKEIVVVDVKSLIVRRSIPTWYQCYGINYTCERLGVSLKNKTYQFIDLSGKTLSTLPTIDTSDHCSVFDNKLYYTAYGNDAVYAAELNGEVCWKFECKLFDFPAGITNDASGNIFVACTGSNQLKAVGKDGKKSRILLSQEDGLKGPHAVHYNRKSNFLLVCNLSGQCFLYKVI